MRNLALLVILLAAAALVIFVLLEQESPEAPQPEADPQPEPMPAVVEPEPPAPVPPLSGTVVDSEGRPVAGALVTAMHLSRDSRPDSASRSVAASGPTDDTGQFAFGELAAGQWMLSAREGERRGYLPMVRVRDSVGNRVVIRLIDPVFIEGRVIRDDRVPISDAVITTDLSGVLLPFFRTVKVIPPVADEKFETRTGPDGCFRLGPMVQGQYDLRVTAPGLEGVLVHAVYAPIDGIDIEMRQGIELTGTIRADPGRDLTGLRVWADLPRPVAFEAEERERGEFWCVVRWFGTGRHRIRAVAEGTCEGFADVDVELGSRPEPFEIQLRPAVPVSGRVLTEGTGDPVPKAEVVFRRVIRRVRERSTYRPRREFGKEYRVGTDDEGSYRTHLSPGLWLAAPECRGYRLPGRVDLDHVDRVLRGSDSPLRRYLLRVSREAVSRDLILERCGILRGRVAFEDGTPAAGAVVTSGYYWRDGIWTGADFNGEYELQGLRRGEVYRFRALLGKDMEQEVRDFELPAGEWECRLDFQLTRSSTGTVRGRVTDPGGRPVAGALVWLNRAPCEAGPDGRFEMRKVETDYVRAVYFAFGFALGAESFEDRAVDGHLDLGDLVLRRRGTGFAGHVTDPEGKPISAALVRATFAYGFPPVEIVTGPNGRFEIFGPAQLDDARIEASAPGRVPVWKRVNSNSPGGDFGLELREVAVIQGAIQVPGHGSCFVELGLRKKSRYSSTWMLSGVQTRNDGRSFRAEVEVSGSYLLRILAEGCAVKDLEAKSLRPGRVLDLGTVLLEPGYTIEGRVAGSEDRPGGISRTLQGATEVGVVELGLTAGLAEDGSFRIDHVPEGTWTLKGYYFGRERGTGTEVIVERGRTATVEVRLGW